MRDKYVYYFLKNRGSNGLYFYDGARLVVASLRFRSSSLLEFIFALYPTCTIIFILGPSLYLLYSMDGDFDPRFTAKAIGNQ
jgi:hypothetical protein